MKPTTYKFAKLYFCLNACIVLKKILGKNSDDKQANNAPKEAMHGKLLPALQSCPTLELGLLTSLSEREVSLVIGEQGTGTFSLRGSAKHF